MLKTGEHDAVMAQFEKDCKLMYGVGRLDREPRESWERGVIYQDGGTNAAFLVYRMGYALGKVVGRGEG